jgi:hypothetical protein
MRCLVLLLAAGCLILPISAQKIKSVQYSPTADFPSYKTYSWAPVKTLESSGLVENNPTFTPVLKEAINAQFTARGLREVPSGGDLEVVSFACRYSSPQMESMAAMDSPINATWAVGGPIGMMSRYNEEGTLAVNLIEAKSKKSSWLAVATSSLGKRTEREKNAERVRKTVAKMFEHFPPKAKK